MTTKPEAIDPLAQVTFTPVDAPAGPAQARQQAEADETAQQEAEMLQAVSLGVSKIVFAGLRALRSFVAKKVPEIMEEWPDELLRGPADAAAPVLQRYMEKFTSFAGRFPEVAMLVISCVPLAMGYVTALDRHSRTVQDVPSKDPA